jgi:hypothetical protein
MGGGTSFTRFLENIGLIQAEKQRLDFEVTDSGSSLGLVCQSALRQTPQLAHALQVGALLFEPAFEKGIV